MDLLILVFTLIAAIYAVVPRVRQLDLRLRIGWFDAFIVLLASLGVLYLEFNDFFAARGWVIHKPWPEGITPRNSIYLVLLVASAILFSRFRLVRLSRKNIEKFRELVEELYWAENYGELFTLLEDHLQDLFRIAREHFSEPFDAAAWSTKDFDSLLGQLGVARKPEKSFSFSIKSFSKKISRRFRRKSQKDSKPRETAKEVIRTALLSSRVMTALARTRPYLGLRVIGEWNFSHERFDFIDQYLTELLRDTSSIFYEEIADNENLLKGHRYHLPESNRLLYFLLHDGKFAHENKYIQTCWRLRHFVSR